MPTCKLVCVCAALALAPAATLACEDPMKDAARFKVADLEVTDTKTGLTWFRCAALHVGKSGQCDPAMVLPSEAWSAAMEVPRNAPKRRSPWRLASVEELDTIAAKGCKYLLNPKYIEVMFDSVWTRSEAPGGRVLRYGVDRRRIESPRALKDDFAQAFYLRDAP